MLGNKKRMFLYFLSPLLTSHSSVASLAGRIYETIEPLYTYPLYQFPHLLGHLLLFRLFAAPNGSPSSSPPGSLLLRPLQVAPFHNREPVPLMFPKLSRYLKGNIKFAAGKPEVQTKLTLLQLILMALLMYPLTMRYGIMSAAIAAMLPPTLSYGLINRIDDSAFYDPAHS